MTTKTIRVEAVRQIDADKFDVLGHRPDDIRQRTVRFQVPYEDGLWAVQQLNRNHDTYFEIPAERFALMLEQIPAELTG